MYTRAAGATDLYKKKRPRINGPSLYTSPQMFFVFLFFNLKERERESSLDFLEIKEEREIDYHFC